MQSWPVQDAKARFSKFLETCLTEGPQMVTRRGQEAVVILSANDYRRMSGTPSLLNLLFNAPRGEPLEIVRSQEPIRDIGL